MDETRTPNPAHSGARGLEQLAHSIAGNDPTPAGGAAAAATTAQGIGLLLKVLRITAPEGADACGAQLEALMERAVAAFEADCAAFASVLAARRGADPERISEAWSRATECPLELVATATQALDGFAPFAAETKRALTLDRQAALELLRAGISISLANAEGNLPSVPGRAERERLGELLEAQRAAARAALARLGQTLDGGAPQDPPRAAR